MSQWGNNNELALQHGGFCTMWSFVAKGLLRKKLSSLVLRIMIIIWFIKAFCSLWNKKQNKAKHSAFMGFDKYNAIINNVLYILLVTACNDLVTSNLDPKRFSFAHDLRREELWERWNNVPSHCFSWRTMKSVSDWCIHVGRSREQAS